MYEANINIMNISMDTQYILKNPFLPNFFIDI